jgi:hypothetical protein
VKIIDEPGQDCTLNKTPIIVTDRAIPVKIAPNYLPEIGISISFFYKTFL